MIKAAKFGLLNPTSGFDAAAHEQLYLRNKLWNNLVELERDHRTKYRALLLAADTELSEIQKKLDRIEETRIDLLASRARLRAKERSQKADTFILDVQIDSLIAERKLLGSRAKELRLEVKQKLTPQIKELDHARYEQVKKLVKGSGLWWGNSETIVAAYDIARIRAMKENTELRFKSFDGTGKFAVRQAGGFLPEDLMNGKLTIARIRALPSEQFSHLSERGQRSKARHELSITIFTTKDKESKHLVRHEVTWPLILHQPIPEGVVKQLHVQRRRIGSEFHWSCSIIVQTGDTPPVLRDHSSIQACGIDMGFRVVKDGLRVAVIAGSDGTIEHVVLTRQWLKRMDHVERLQGILAEMAHATWTDLRQILSVSKTLPDELGKRVEKLLHAGDKVPVKGMRVLRNMLAGESEIIPAALAILDEWTKKSLRVSREMHNLRDKLIAQRNDIYRNVAHKIATKYSLVRIEDMKLRNISIVRTDDGSENPLPLAARKNRQRAALFELALFINQACIKSGSEFEKMEAAYSSITCSSCGSQNLGIEDIHFICGGCQSLHDQDENSAKNFLRGEEFYSRRQSVA